uniref:PH domain-containing protein n=1 Tax=Arion vulgaris TaxID=1028688 RepID=A0A0B6ZV76_9EUPU
MYQIYRQPIPATELVVEDLPDGEVKMGSFRSAFGQGGQTAKNLIRLSFQDTDRGQSHTLIISDEHDKRQWMQAFNKVASKILIVVNENKTKEKTAQ